MYLLNEEVAAEAYTKLIEPMIISAMDTEIYNRAQGHMVIAKLDTPEGLSETDWLASGILTEFSIGQRDQWERNFKEIARSKCYQAWKHKCSTHLLQIEYPHLFDTRYTTFYGGSYLFKIATAFSGVEPFFDLHNSVCMASACRAFCTQKLHASKKDENGFLRHS